MAAVTHHDLEPGQVILVSLGRGSDASGWFQARVRKRYSRGAQVLFLEGPQKGVERAVQLSRVRLLEAEKPAKPVKPVKPVKLVPPPSEPQAPVPSATAEGDAPPEDLQSSLDAWLEMGREILAPLENRMKELDTQMAELELQKVEIDALVAELGQERVRVAKNRDQLRKILGGTK